MKRCRHLSDSRPGAVEEERVAEGRHAFAQVMVEALGGERRLDREADRGIDAFGKQEWRLHRHHVGNGTGYMRNRRIAQKKIGCYGHDIPCGGLALQRVGDDGQIVVGRTGCEAAILACQGMVHVKDERSAHPAPPFAASSRRTSIVCVTQRSQVKKRARATPSSMCVWRSTALIPAARSRQAAMESTDSGSK